MYKSIKSCVIVGETVNAFFNCDLAYTACKSLANWWGLFLGTSHFDLERGQKYPPVGIYGGGGAFPLELQISLKQSHLCQFLINSKDLYICGSAMTYTMLQK